MLAGCSSSLLSPRHRLRSETSEQFQACHFPSMSTQRLDLPCTFPRKEASRSQPIRSIGISVEKPIEAKTNSCSLKQSIRLPPSPATAQTPFAEARREKRDEFWEKKSKSLKRFAEQASFEDELCVSTSKRKKGNEEIDDSQEWGGNQLSISKFGSGNFWFQQPGFEVPRPVPQLPFSLSCSGEEDRVCFVPSDVISLPLPNNPWVESTEITEFGDKNVEATNQGPRKETSGSSTSSESHNSLGGLRLNENPSEHEIGNGGSTRSPNPTQSADAAAGRHEHDGFELVSLLMACVEAIGSKNIPGINHFIASLGQLASPRGSPISRLTAYFTEALALRVARLWPHVFHITTPRELDRIDDDAGNTFRLLNQVSPIPKFIHFTANEILLRAFEGKDRVHIIDFDIKQGLQWPSLFQSLASRTNPPSHIRITGIGESKQELIETGDRLAGFAEAFNLPFEFHHVVDRLEDVRLWMLHVKEKESVGVNCIFQLHKMLYDGNGGALRDFLGLIRSTNPAIVIMAEQEAMHNELSLEARISNSMKYYSAIFDSVDASSLPMDSPVRIKIEEMFAREIRNVIACEGRERLERHQTFGKWKKLMEEGGGFRSMGISQREFLQSQMLLKMYSCENFRVEKLGHHPNNNVDGDALSLCWLDQPLYSVSSWSPVDLVGSSSSYSQPS